MGSFSLSSAALGFSLAVVIGIFILLAVIARTLGDIRDGGCRAQKFPPFVTRIVNGGAHR